tara:strand:+ start:2653 stop:4020 length:1368 start_codon:yes stop_codon:yes gene_type:complete
MAFGPPNTLSSQVPPTGAPADINTILTQEAGRIGADIHKATLHTSPWIDLIKQSTFPEGMGYELNTLIYDRALPIRPMDKDLGDDDGSNLIGNNWTEMSTLQGAATRGYTTGQTADTKSLPTGGDNVNHIDFSKVIKSYKLGRSVIESPRINVEELRYAAHRAEQLRAIMDLLKESSRQSWEDRYRQQYDSKCDNVVYAKTASSKFATDAEDKPTFTAGSGETALTVDATGQDGADDDTLDVTANISNALLDKAYFQLVRKGGGTNAYGRENGRPVFTLVCSSEASYQLQTEAGFRDDVRYNSAKVSDLIAPLGVEKSFRGYYHLIDDMAPRFSTTLTGAATLTQVPVYTVNSTNNNVVVNSAYDDADIEAAYILHQDVMESLIPAPLSGGNGLSFDPVGYKGEFKWTNIPDVLTNPDGTIGFFRGIMANASKPIKTEFGYVILFKRTSTTPAAV